MDTNRIQRAAEIVRGIAAQGYQVVTVVSAMGHTTDHLLGLAQALKPTPDAREIDALLSTGEQISASLMTIAIQAMGLRAKSFTGAAAGITTNSNFGAAGIEHIEAITLQKHLNQGFIPVVAGFQGIDRNGDITTLGRAGSDATAIALAAALKAERCDIYTDVEGVYSVDPRMFKQAYKLDSISYKDMFAMAKCGAKVLQPCSVEIAMMSKIPVRVRSTFNPDDEGTLVTEEAEQVNSFTGIAVDKTKCCLKIVLNQPATSERSIQRAFRHERHTLKNSICGILSKAGIEIEFGRSIHHSACEVSFSLSQSDLEQALKLIHNAKKTSEYKAVMVETNLVKLSIIGAQLSSSYEVGIMLSLTKAGIPISLVSTHNTLLSVMIPAEAAEQAVALTHENYCPLQLAC